VAVLPIVFVSDHNDVLTTKATRVPRVDDEIRRLMDDMVETMFHANGVGLAAPQVGVSLRVIVLRVDNQIYQLANPEMVRNEGDQTGLEGCLSIPGFRGYVMRPHFVTVRAQNAKGEFFDMRGEDLLARAFCHEIDHLNGILFLQHLSMLKRDLIRRKIKKLRKEGEW